MTVVLRGESVTGIQSC